MSTPTTPATVPGTTMLDWLLRYFWPRVVPVALALASIFAVAAMPGIRHIPAYSHQWYHLGVLHGGLLSLALVALLFAAINRQWVYVLFAAWLLGNLRMATMAMGWDGQWLGHVISPDWLPALRRLAAPAYYLLTYLLFTELFRHDLSQIGRNGLQRALLAVGLALLPAAALLSYGRFWPISQAACLIGLAGMLFLLLKIFLTTRSRVAVWSIAALLLVVCAGTFAWFGDVRATFLVERDFFLAATALGSSMIVALAIAEHTHAEHNARVHAQAELQGTYEVTPVGLFTLAADGTIERVNSALEQLLSTFDIHIGQSRWADYFGEQEWLNLHRAANRNSPAEIRIGNSHNGKTLQRQFLARVAKVHNQIEGSLQDITEHTNTVRQLRTEAHHDPLTGALNTRGINSNLEQALGQVSLGKSFSLAYLNLNPQRVTSDIYGHKASERALRRICAQISAVLSENQKLGRVDADEFIIVYQDTPFADATRLSQTILDGLRQAPQETGNRGIQAHSIMGLVEITSALRPQDAISVAARACRMAAKGDRGKVLVYDHGSEEIDEHFQELALLKELGSGLTPERLFLEMQPIMALHHPRASLNFEVLLRMKNKNGGLISTEKVIAAAEQNGVVALIDKWVLRATLDWLKRNRQRLANTRFVCINVNGMSLNDDVFVSEFFVTLNRYQSLARILCIEITESVALQNMDNTRWFIERLQAMGVRVALDDFGAGYTSFSYLSELPADIIKIDGQFVKDTTRSSSSAAMVETIVTLADNLGMESIAEWVEDYDTLIALRKMGVDYVQGHVVAKPMSPSALLGGADITSFITNDTLRAAVLADLK
jgi:diguanylate cyclase (GGDEF)-like protein